MLNSESGQQAAHTQTKLEIQLKRRRQVKKPLFRNGNILIFFTPVEIVLKPHEEQQINMRVQINFPRQLIPEFVTFPSLTKTEIESDISINEKQMLEVKLFNKSFTNTVRIEKNSGIVALYFLNDYNVKFKILNSYL